MSENSPNPESLAWGGLDRHTLSSTAISVVIHGVMLLLLALVAFPKHRIKPDFVVMETVVVDNPIAKSDDNFEVQPPKLIENSVNNLANLQPTTNVIAEQPNMLNIDVNQNELQARIEAEAFLGQDHREGDFAGRSEEARTILVNEFGGNASTEAAVANGLKWLAEHQQEDGSWHFDHRGDKCDGTCNSPGNLNRATVAATSLALMSFLGAGNTHLKGKYKPQVERGLNYLMSVFAKAETPGDMREIPSGNSAFYTQGLATITLCEAYGMSGDRRLLKPAQACIDFIIDSQHPEAGGWRYRLGEVGDTSVVGWQVMALASARLSRISVPVKPRKLAERFLDSVQLDQGAYYGYTGPEKKPSTTAVGLLSRLYLGWTPDRPEVKKGVAYLSSVGPSRDDMYYNYYATQVLHHHGGPEWVQWNKVMREQLLETQDRSDGHAAGSWAPRDRHGAAPGGRHYMTCLSVLTLEVYYRHLPIYQRASIAGKEY
ncbi:MAG: terpene cyclase/mutase family protein [Planctomycetaceae bacterium]|nr:terpene cyclase/mutase family protein [Planctomycetaceae bacterium]